MPHDLDDGRDPRGIVSHRHQLINGTAGIDIDIDGGKLRFSNVPLFREVDGVLKQAVRVRVPGRADAATITVRISRQGAILDSRTIETTSRPSSHFLLVPEVESTELALVEIVEGDRVVTSAPFEIESQRKWTIHLVHQSHYDIGYTDTQSTVLESQLSFIDAALELCTLTDDWDDNAKFRWNIEVTWPLQHWLRTRPRAAREELKRRITEGRIEVHALPFSMHTEAYSMDELAKQLAFAGELRREHGIEIISAMQTDVPGATIGLSTLLTDSGIKYFCVAHNYAGRSVPFLNDGQELTRPFYWQAPDGEKLLVWYTDTLNGIAYMEGVVLGFGHGYNDVLGSLPEYLNALAQRPYPYGDSTDWLAGNLLGLELTKTPYAYDVLHLRVQSAFADNASPSLMSSEIVRTWNDEWEYPRLRTSIDRDFFTEVETKFSDQLDTFAGDWTDWWADGIGSAAIALGVNRQSQSDIRSAQTLNALADLITDEANPAIAAATGRAYEEMALFDEHTWGAANPWNAGSVGFDTGAHEWVRKEAFAFTAAEVTTSLLNGGLQRIAALGAGSNRNAEAQTLLVFNPSSWSRTDLVRVFLPERSLDVPTLTLVDSASGNAVPYTVEAQTNPNHRPRGRFIHFLATDVPPVGYARYELIAGENAGESVITASGEANIANDHLSLAIDLPTATVRSLVDIGTGRELVADGAPFGFNAYVYDRYASGTGFNHLSGRIGSAGPWLLGSRGTGQYGLVTRRESNAVWERLTVRASGDGADWLETTYTLPHGLSRLQISNRLNKPSTMQKESVYFAFPFAVDDGAFSFEITGGIASKDSPHVPGSADHFRAIRHWATVTADGNAPIAWATGEAPLLQTGNIHLPYGPFTTTIPDWAAHPTTIYSWALNNLWDTNFPPEQGGEMRFRYAVGVGGDDAIALGRDTGASVAQPLLGVVTPLGAKAVGDFAARGSFVESGHPLIEVSHLAAARDGGVAIFLQSHASEPVQTTIDTSLLPVSSAQIGNFLEEDLQSTTINGGKVTVAIAPGELKAVVVR